MFKKLSGLVRKSRFSLKNPSPLKAWGADLIEALGAGTSSGVTKPYKQSVWVYRCLNQWCRVAQVPLLLHDGSGEDVSDASLSLLLAQPFPRQTMQQLLEQIFLSFGNHGEYFLLKEDGTATNRLPMYLEFKDPCVMSLRPGDVAGGIVQSWSIKQKGGTYRRVPAEGVIHDFLPNPYSRFRGLSPLVPARASIDADFAARMHNAFQMNRHGRLSGILSMKEDVGEETLELIGRKWNEAYEGKENAGKTAILSGAADYKQLAMSAKDMDWATGQNMSREEICAAFGISTIVAGGLMGATFSNYEMAMQAAWQETLIPLGKRIEAKLNSELIQPHAPAGYHVRFDFENAVAVLQDDQTAKVDRYLKLVSGKMTPKQAANICQLDLGDPDPAHDVVWISSNEMPANFALDPVEPVAPPPAPPTEPKKAVEKVPSRPSKPSESDEADEPMQTPCSCKDHVSEDSKQVDTINVKASTPIQKARINANLRQIKTMERKMEKTLKAYFYEQRKDVLKRLSEMPPDGMKAVVAKAEFNEEWVDQILAGEDWGAKLKKRMRPLVESVAQIGARQVVAESGNRFEPILVDSFIKNQMTLMDKVNETTREALIAGVKDVAESIVAGTGTDELMDALKTSFKGVYNNTEARRRTIARTETTRAMNGGRMEQMKAIGAPMKQWITINDGNERHTHGELDGKVVKAGDYFKAGLSFPGDPSAPASETINCRCSVIPLFDLQDA